MNKAIRITASTFGALMGAAGIEHGMGEILQGGGAPEAIFFRSWPNSDFFRIYNGEPALSLVPNLMVTGALTLLFSTGFLLAVVFLIHRPRIGWLLAGLSVAMLLTGGGLFPPVLGLLLGAFGSASATPLAGLRTRIPAGLLRILGGGWGWAYGAALAAWAWLMPGLNLLDSVFGVRVDGLIGPTLLAALLSLALAVFLAAARDIRDSAPGN